MSGRSEIEGYDPLYGRDGRRKYLTRAEWVLFLRAAGDRDPETSAFAQLLAYSGCRISEALAVTPCRLDPGTCCVIFRTLKRRRQMFRAVPIPKTLMAVLLVIAEGKQADATLWAWSRVTAWHRVKEVMAEAGVSGAQAMPKGLRHAFGVANAEENVPLGLTRQWMGHARIETTAIYQNAVGEEERAFARRIWRRSRPGLS